MLTPQIRLAEISVALAHDAEKQLARRLEWHTPALARMAQDTAAQYWVEALVRFLQAVKS